MKGKQTCTHIITMGLLSRGKGPLDPEKAETNFKVTSEKYLGSAPEPGRHV